ncbi:MAG: hypothetical protein AAF633_15670, partial [Chloroflexota bacterium]
MTVSSFYGDGNGGSGYSWQPTATQDANGNITAVTNWIDGVRIEDTRQLAGSETLITQFQYEDSVRPWLITNVIAPNGSELAYRFDSWGRYVETKGPGPNLGDTTATAVLETVEYLDGDAPFGVKKTVAPGTTEEGVSITYVDNLGTVLQQMQSIEDGKWAFQDFKYDVLGRPICQTVTALAPDPANGSHDGRFLTINCEEQAHTLTEYDDINLITKTTAPNGAATVQQIASTTVNNVRTVETSITDPLGRRSASFANDFGQVIMVREPGDFWGTYYSYDALGNLTEVRDRQATRNVTTIGYDTLGRKTSMADPDMGSWTYKYDFNGNLVEQLDANGQYLCFYYDNLNRMTSKWANAGTCAAAATDNDQHLAAYQYGDQVSYGQIGQLAKASWAPDHTQNFEIFDYDAAGRLIAHGRTLDGEGPFVMRYGDFSRLSQAQTMTYPDGEAVTMTYDVMGGDTLTSESQTLVDQISYNARGQMRWISRPNGANTTYTYYPAAEASPTGEDNFQLKEISHSGITKYLFEYDLVGNIEKIEESSGAVTDTQTFTYDVLNRLDTAASTTNGLAYDYDYHYDVIGNIDYIVKNGSRLEYSTGGSGQTTFAPGYGTTHSGHTLPHAVTQVGSQTFRYDNNGNMVLRNDETGSYRQTFDAENRLIEVTDTIFEDDFSSLKNGEWILNQHQSVPASSNDLFLRNVGTGSSYEATFKRGDGFNLESGDRVTFDFKVDNQNTVTHLGVASNNGGTTTNHDTYERLAILGTTNGIVAQIWRKAYNPSQTLHTLIPAEDFEINTWYSVSIVIDDIGGSQISVYQKDDPTNSGFYRVPSNTFTPEKAWRFQGWTYRNTTDLDNYVEGRATWFYYDASGQRTLTIGPDGSTTYYPFPNYEETHSPVPVEENDLCSASAPISIDECNTALVVLRALGYPNLDAELENIGSICNWQRMDCSNGRIVELRLTSAGLTGSIPSEISALDWLIELRLNGNANLSGELPNSITNLMLLRTLDYRGTAVCSPPSGPVREWLDQMTDLYESGIECETDLAALYCPSEQQITESECRSAIAVLEGLGYRNLEASLADSGSICGLTGDVFCESGHVTRLHLSFASLSGSIPSEIGNLPNLIMLDLEANTLSGPIPAEIGNLSQLEQIYLEANRLTGEIPPNLGQLPNLIILSMSANNFTGEIPPSLGNLSALQYFTVGRNDLTGEIPGTFGNLTALKVLSLHENNLSGEIPPQLDNLSQLESLVLTDTDLEGEIPATFTKLTNLQDFRYQNSAVCSPQSGPLRAWLESLNTWIDAGLSCESEPPACGGLVQEAESGLITGEFDIGNDSEASGGQYIFATADDTSATDPNGTPAAENYVTYCFNVTEAGTYRLNAQTHAANNISDSFFVTIGDQSSTDPNRIGFLWDVTREDQDPQTRRFRPDYLNDRGQADPVEVELQAGEHEVVVMIREENAQLDTLELERVGGSNPTPVPPTPTFTPTPTSTPTGDVCG